MTMKRSSAFSVYVLLVFDIHDPNSALFLKVSFSFLQSASLVPVTLILSFTTIYASLLSHKSDLSIEVSNLIFSLIKY